jgi:VCBS repeat-containing protein
VLVCKTCNNKAGSEYESKLSEIIEKECFNKKIPKSTVKASVTISDIRGWHKGKFSIDEDGQYKFDLTTNQTKNLPELAQWENEVVGDWEMKVTIKHADETKLVKALIKTVYLYCFNHWGYSFIFSNSCHLMRQVLSEQKSYPIKIPSILLDFKSDKFNSKIEGFHTGVVFISEPKTVQSIFVNIPIELKHLSYKCLIPIQIPNPTDQSIEEMQRINKLLLKEKSISVKLAPIDFPDPYMQNSFSYTWNSLLSQFN